VVSNQRPRITFDEKGVCGACHVAELKRTVIDWKHRERELVELLEQHRSRDGSYDVIVPASGGKDSATVAHMLKYQYGMHPLTATWAPNLFTEIGWKNYQNLIHVGGFDNVMGTPNGKVHRALTRLSFEHLGDPLQSFVYGQKAFPMQIAVKYKVPLIMYGEDGEVEYGGDMKAVGRCGHDYSGDMMRHYFSGIGALEWTKYGLEAEDLRAYMPPSEQECRELGLKIRFFGYYRKWLPKENYHYAAKHTGFMPNPERTEGTYTDYASIDDRIDGMHYYMSFIKFGIGRATSDAAHEIRDGLISRPEGVALVRRYDSEFPAKYHGDFLEYTELTEQRARDIIDSFRPPHLWERVAGEWRLKHQIS
jgi:N-acetyl sugar amidotransferase